MSKKHQFCKCSNSHPTNEKLWKIFGHKGETVHNFKYFRILFPQKWCSGFATGGIHLSNELIHKLEFDEMESNSQVDSISRVTNINFVNFGGKIHLQRKMKLIDSN